MDIDLDAGEFQQPYFQIDHLEKRAIDKIIVPLWDTGSISMFVNKLFNARDLDMPRGVKRSGLVLIDTIFISDEKLNNRYVLAKYDNTGKVYKMQEVNLSTDELWKVFSYTVDFVSENERGVFSLSEIQRNMFWNNQMTNKKDKFTRTGLIKGVVEDRRTRELNVVEREHLKDLAKGNDPRLSEELGLC